MRKTESCDEDQRRKANETQKTQMVFPKTQKNPKNLKKKKRKKKKKMKMKIYLLS
jgi:hypothetical protein